MSRRVCTLINLNFISLRHLCNSLSSLGSRRSWHSPTLSHKRDVLRSVLGDGYEAQAVKDPQADVKNDRSEGRMKWVRKEGGLWQI